MSRPVTIPHPCAQNWDNMNPAKGGKFCTSCSKTVHDLTQLPDEELIRFLHEKGPGICARFRTEQLAPVRPKSIFSTFRLRAASIAALIFAKLLMPSSAKAQDAPVTNEEPQMDRIKNVKSDSVIYHVSGNVKQYFFNRTDTAGIGNVRIYVKAGSQLVEFGQTDDEGHFELNIPAKSNQEKIDFVFRKNGYYDVRLKNYLPDSKPIEIEVKHNKHWKPVACYTMGCPSF